MTPAAIPVITPEELPSEIIPPIELQVPPVVELASVAVSPVQIDKGPVIGPMANDDNDTNRASIARFRCFISY